uniref:Magnesium-dependent phosphatase-1 n=1 Tax=Pseudo-nitzschia australis TaxID=44445 RepID=A0A7S4EFJ6_9STRA
MKTRLPTTRLPYTFLLLLASSASLSASSAFAFQNNHSINTPTINTIGSSINIIRYAFVHIANRNYSSRLDFGSSMSMSTTSSSSFNEKQQKDPRCGIDYPELVVFDLDACFWDQEMYEMPALPSKTVSGPLGDSGKGTGITGAYSGRNKISMHPGSMVALQEHASGDVYPGMKVCFASSADTPFAEKIGRATLKLLEVLPGLTVWDLVLQDWDGQDVNQYPHNCCWSCCFLLTN